MKTPKEVAIKLDYPVQLADRRLEEISMRRPTVRDHLDFPISETTPPETDIKLFARLTGLDFEDLAQLDLGDLEKLQDQFMLFRKPDELKGNSRSGRAAVPPHPLEQG